MIPSETGLNITKALKKAKQAEAIKKNTTDVAIAFT